MGREIRRVPVGFEPGYNEHGHIQPMHQQTLAEANAEWEENRKGELANGMSEEEFVEEYYGEKPSDQSDEHKAYYQPEGWPPEEERGWAVYETVSEGTPVTPTFATKFELINHLIKHGTKADPPMSQEGARSFVEQGWVPSFVGRGNVIRSGLQDVDARAT